MLGQFMVFLHVVGAVILGYYLILPFLLLRTKHLSGESLGSYVENLHKASSIVQYALIIELLTGGYMMINADYAVMWIILGFVFFLLVGALSGIMNKNMKTALSQLSSGQPAEQPLGTAKSLGIIVCLSLLVVLYLMMYPMVG